MSVERFENFLSQQVAEKVESKPFDWTTRRNRWIRHLDLFYKSVESFLQSYINEKKVKIFYGREDISEFINGKTERYEVKNAIISFGTNRIELKPMGTIMVGCKGCVNLIGPKGKASFLLVESAASGLKISFSVKTKSNEEVTKDREFSKEEEWEWKILESSTAEFLARILREVIGEFQKKVYNSVN